MCSHGIGMLQAASTSSLVAGPQCVSELSKWLGKEENLASCISSFMLGSIAKLRIDRS